MLSKKCFIVFASILLVGIISAGVYITLTNNEKVIIEKNSDNSYTIYKPTETITLTKAEKTYNNYVEEMSELVKCKDELYEQCLTDTEGDCEIDWNDYPELKLSTDKESYIRDCEEVRLIDCEEYVNWLIKDKQRLIDESLKKLNRLKSIK